MNSLIFRFNTFIFQQVKKALKYCVKLYDSLLWDLTQKINTRNVLVLICLYFGIHYLPDEFLREAIDYQKFALQIGTFLGVILTLEIALYSLLVQKLNEILPPLFFDKLIRKTSQVLIFVFLALSSLTNIMIYVFNFEDLSSVFILKFSLFTLLVSFFLVYELFNTALSAMNFQSPIKTLESYCSGIIQYSETKITFFESFLQLNPSQSQKDELSPSMEAYIYNKNFLEEKLLKVINEFFDLFDKFYNQGYKQFSYLILYSLHKLILSYLTLRKKTKVYNLFGYRDTKLFPNSDSDFIIQPYLRRWLNAALQCYYEDDQDGFCKLLNNLFLLSKDSTSLEFVDESNQDSGINSIFESSRDILCNQLLVKVKGDREFTKLVLNSITGFGGLAIYQNYEIARLQIPVYTLSFSAQEAVNNKDYDLFLFIFEKFVALTIVASEVDLKWFSDHYDYLKVAIYSNLNKVDRHICLDLVKQIFGMFEGIALTALGDFYFKERLVIESKSYQYYFSMALIIEGFLDEFLISKPDMDYAEKIFEILITPIRMLKTLIDIQNEYPDDENRQNLINRLTEKIYNVLSLVQKSSICNSFNDFGQYHLFFKCQ